MVDNKLVSLVGLVSTHAPVKERLKDNGLNQASLVGFEPTLNTLEGYCFIQLSYRDLKR